MKQRPAARQSRPARLPPAPQLQPHKKSQTLRCMVCLDSVDRAAPTTTVCPNTREGAHGACFECLRSYVEFEIRNNMGAPCVCPEPSCRRVLADAELRTLLPLDKLQHYRRLQLERSGTEVRECPRCGTAVAIGAANLKPDAPKLPALECPARRCRHEFCMHHGDAHAGRSCPVVCESPLAALQSAWWRLWHTRRCPKCGVSTEKNGGCPHMTCRRCGHGWCWHCRAPTHGGCGHPRFFGLLAAAVLAGVVGIVSIVGVSSLLAVAWAIASTVLQYGALAAGAWRLWAMLSALRSGTPRTAAALVLGLAIGLVGIEVLLMLGVVLLVLPMLVPLVLLAAVLVAVGGVGWLLHTWGVLLPLAMGIGTLLAVWGVAVCCSR